jgi:hypothetical protein
MRGISQVYPRSIATSSSEQASPAKPPHQAFKHLILAIRHELRTSQDARNGSTQHVRQQRQLRNVLTASADSGPSIQLLRRDWGPPLSTSAAPMFAPCLLGCPGTTRYPGASRYQILRRLHGNSAGVSVKAQGVRFGLRKNQRTLNPRVRGSSPWRRTRTDLGFYRPRLFFSCPFCPHVCSMFARAHGPSNPGLVKNDPSGARCGGNRPGVAPSRTVGAVPGSLDQWSRPSGRACGTRPESHSDAVTFSEPAGKRHSHGGYVGGADAPDGRLVLLQINRWSLTWGSFDRLSRLVVLVDQAVEHLAPPDRQVQRRAGLAVLSGRSLLAGLVRAVPVVMAAVLAED